MSNIKRKVVWWLVFACVAISAGVVALYNEQTLFGQLGLLVIVALGSETITDWLMSLVVKEKKKPKLVYLGPRTEQMAWTSIASNHLLDRGIGFIHPGEVRSDDVMAPFDDLVGDADLVLYLARPEDRNAATTDADLTFHLPRYMDDVSKLVFMYRDPLGEDVDKEERDRFMEIGKDIEDGGGTFLVGWDAFVEYVDSITE